MNYNEHTTPEKLERYAFLWSLINLVITAFSLFFGAMPIAYMFMGSSSNLVSSLLPLAWLITGAAAIYLGYLFHKNEQKLFGGTDKKNKITFLIMVVTGINIGFAAISTNIAMGLVWDMPIADIIFKAFAVLYLYIAWHLYTQWKAHGETLFGSTATVPMASHEPGDSEMGTSEEHSE